MCKSDLARTARAASSMRVLAAAGLGGGLFVLDRQVVAAIESLLAVGSACPPPLDLDEACETVGVGSAGWPSVVVLAFAAVGILALRRWAHAWVGTPLLGLLAGGLALACLVDLWLVPPPVPIADVAWIVAAVGVLQIAATVLGLALLPRMGLVPLAVAGLAYGSSVLARASLFAAAAGLWPHVGAAVALYILYLLVVFVGGLFAFIALTAPSAFGRWRFAAS